MIFHLLPDFGVFNPVCVIFYYQWNALIRKKCLVRAKIKKTVLIFAGTEDSVVINLDKKLANEPAQDNIQIQVMDGADHSFRDLYTEEIVELSVEFINAIP